VDVCEGWKRTNENKSLEVDFISKELRCNNEQIEANGNRTSNIV